MIVTMTINYDNNSNNNSLIKDNGDRNCSDCNSGTCYMHKHDRTMITITIITIMIIAVQELG